MARSAPPTCVSAFCCASTVSAFFSARSTKGSTASIASCCTPAGATASDSPPFFRPRTVAASTLELSRTSAKAGGAAEQRLRHRLGEPLRLHQRLAAGADLRRAAAGRVERGEDHHQQAEQAERDQRQQDALLARQRQAADQRQPVRPPEAAVAAAERHLRLAEVGLRLGRRGFGQQRRLGLRQGRPPCPAACSSRRAAPARRAGRGRRGQHLLGRQRVSPRPALIILFSTPIWPSRSCPSMRRSAPSSNRAALRRRSS